MIPFHSFFRSTWFNVNTIGYKDSRNPTTTWPSIKFKLIQIRTCIFQTASFVRRSRRQRIYSYTKQHACASDLKSRTAMTAKLFTPRGTYTPKIESSDRIHIRYKVFHQIYSACSKANIHSLYKFKRPLHETASDRSDRSKDRRKSTILSTHHLTLY